MRVIYLTDAIGSKRNGGSGLSGLRFLELLIARYGYVEIVTDAIRNTPVPGTRYGVITIKSNPPRFGSSLRALARFIAIRLINLPRRRVAMIDAGGDSVLIVCNSFTRLLDRVHVCNASSVRLACVVRGDTNSFDFQAFGETAGPDTLSAPLAFLHRFDGLIFVSQTTKRNWEEVLTRPQKRYLLPNAIDEREVDELLARPVESVRASLGWQSDEFHIVVVGSIQKRKGQDIFVPASKALRASLPHARVHFVGGVSPPWGGIEMAEALRGAGGDRYVVHGHRDDALALVRAADVAVMVSNSEAFPRSVAEYMALAKAIVSTPVAGADEMVTDGETGVIMPMGDPVALVEALVAMAADPERRSRLGDAARKRYLTEYSIASQTLRFAEIFDDVDATFDYSAAADARQAYGPNTAVSAAMRQSD